MTVELVHLWATLAMTGVIWFVQVVHYPLFAAVGADGFQVYAAQHVRRTTWVVAPLMLTEVGTAAWILGFGPGAGGGLAIVGMILLIGIWLSTALLQVPRHRQLEQGFDPVVVRGLVQTNWLRTALWTARAGLAAALLG